MLQDAGRVTAEIAKAHAEAELQKAETLPTVNREGSGSSQRMKWLPSRNFYTNQFEHRSKRRMAMTPFNRWILHRF